MEIKGRIYKVLETTQGKSRDGKEWSKQEFIFEFFENPTDRYSDKVVLSVMNDRIREYDLHEGDEVTIGFGHSVREYNGRWYNDLRMYKLEKDSRNTLSEQEIEQLRHNLQNLQEEVKQAQEEVKQDNDPLPF